MQCENGRLGVFEADVSCMAPVSALFAWGFYVARPPSSDVGALVRVDNQASDVAIPDVDGDAVGQGGHNDRDQRVNLRNMLTMLLSLFDRTA